MPSLCKKKRCFFIFVVGGGDEEVSYKCPFSAYACYMYLLCGWALVKTVKNINFKIDVLCKIYHYKHILLFMQYSIFGQVFLNVMWFRREEKLKAAVRFVSYHINVMLQSMWFSGCDWSHSVWLPWGCYCLNCGRPINIFIEFNLHCKFSRQNHTLKWNSKSQAHHKL